MTANARCLLGLHQQGLQVLQGVLCRRLYARRARRLHTAADLSRRTRLELLVAMDLESIDGHPMISRYELRGVGIRCKDLLPANRARLLRRLSVIRQPSLIHHHPVLSAARPIGYLKHHQCQHTRRRNIGTPKRAAWLARISTLSLPRRVMGGCRK